MRNVFAIARRELLSFFVSPIAYFVITGFVLLSGYFFFRLLEVFNIVLMQYRGMPGYAGMQLPSLNEFVVGNFFMTLLTILVFAIPLITMRTVAEERRTGTFELLATSPLSVWEIVVGKYLATATIIALMVCLAGIFPALLVIYANPEVAPILSGLFGVLLCALGFASIGVAVSAFCESQTVAGFLTMVLLLLLYVIYSPSEAAQGPVEMVLQHLSPIEQTQDLVKGLIKLGALAYHLSVIALGIFVAQRALEAQRWR